MEEFGLELAFKGICKSSVFLYKSLRGSDCKRLQEIANNLLPTVEEMCASNSESASKLSLEKFKEFHDNLVEVNTQAADHATTANLIEKIQINKGVKKLEKSINEFIKKDLQIIMACAQLHLSNKLNIVRALQYNMIQAQVDLSTELGSMSDGMQILGEKVDAVDKAVVVLREAMVTEVRSVGKAVETVQKELKNFKSAFYEQIERSPDSCRPPDTPSDFLGFGEHITKLKKVLLEEGVNLVAVTAMGGAGKSTLAAAVCNDRQITEYFKKTIIYIEVTASPDLFTILKTIWKKITGERSSDFVSVRNAREELQSHIKSRNEPILVVLDDIWETAHLNTLVLKGKQYKTLVTTRNSEVITNGFNTRIYELPLLQTEHALSLFCLYAFNQTSIPTDRNQQVVLKVQQKCIGLPLALKVIGRSLYGKSDHDWERTEKGLLAGELVNSLKTSIDVLEEDEKHCFLDLGAFPQRKVIPAKALLDIWVYVRELKSGRAKRVLRKFADRHLLELKKNRGNSQNIDDSMDGYSISQHGIMRDLALSLASEVNSRTLYMPKMGNQLPFDWTNLSSKAQIVSIHTEAMKDSDWPEMEFPKAKALVLYFTATEYCLPTFLHTMKKLKVLIIYNCHGAKRSKLNGVSGFQKLSQLKTLYLERLIVPEECNDLKSLEKINMSFCVGLDRNIAFNFSGLLEFNVSYCIDLEELPAGLCSSGCLKKLSVTNCHRLAKLPDEMGRFELLKKIRLFGSPELYTLPSSIGNLKYLEKVDISSCLKLKVERTQRCELKETLNTITKTPSLKWVLCDKVNEQLFERVPGTDLKVHFVEEQAPNLDFLYSEF